MPGITRVSADTAGGTLLTTGGNSHVRVQGNLVAQPGGTIQGHGPGPHGAPVMVGASSYFKINGVGICRAGDAASCGHLATGSSYATSD